MTLAAIPGSGRPRRVAKRSLVTVGIAVLLAALLYLPSVGPAHSERYRTEAACHGSATSHIHVRVPASGGHYADVAVDICHNGSIVKWASQPSVTFPSFRIWGVPAPQAALESLSASTPRIYSYGAGLYGNKRITWRFTVTVKALKAGIPIATETYYFRVYPAYSELQGHGSVVRRGWLGG